MYNVAFTHESNLASHSKVVDIVDLTLDGF